MDDLQAFARFVEAVRPWLPQLVIVGGWAHRLHRLHDFASPPQYVAIATADLDIAIPARGIEGDIGAALKAAQFKEEFSGEHNPPVTEYRLGDAMQGFFVEFLAPLNGSGTRRDGSADATTKQAGVVAQKLRHLDVLLLRPWVVSIDSEQGFPVTHPAQISIPNAVTFIAQRLLIQSSRTAGKQAQDALYVYETIQLFAERLGELRKLWAEAIQPALTAKQIEAVHKAISEQYGSVTETIRSAARIPQDHALRPEEMQAVCQAGLKEVFGD